MSQRVMIFPIKENISAKYYQDLLNCLPAYSTILSIRQDYNSLYLHVFVRSEFFSETDPGTICPQVRQLSIIEEDGTKRMEWRWRK
jgi:hypothetical protein